jgi:hypothetical protein
MLPMRLANVVVVSLWLSPTSTASLKSEGWSQRRARSIDAANILKDLLHCLHKALSLQ